jgi:hypothetical protein
MFNVLLFVLTAMCLFSYFLFLLATTALGVAADIGVLAGVVRRRGPTQTYNEWLFDVARGRMFGPHGRD